MNGDTGKVCVVKIEYHLRVASADFSTVLTEAKTDEQIRLFTIA